MSATTHTAYIGLGANLGNPQQTIQAAIQAISELPSTQLIRSSSLYSSAPIDAVGNDYINAVAELHTQLSPTELLTALQAIELQYGRTRDFHNAPRTLDLDVLLFDQLSINTDTLQIPHPRMTQRAFVILPLLEIAPEITIPNHGAAKSRLPNLQNQIIKKL